MLYGDTEKYLPLASNSKRKKTPYKRLFSEVITLLSGLLCLSHDSLELFWVELGQFSQALTV